MTNESTNETNIAKMPDLPPHLVAAIEHVPAELHQTVRRLYVRIRRQTKLNLAFFYELGQIVHELFRAIKETRPKFELDRVSQTRATIDRVAMLVDRAEYKRRQAPPGVKITARAFGKDRRLPITQTWSG
jgi:hypothetical protein